MSSMPPSDQKSKKKKKPKKKPPTNSQTTSTSASIAADADEPSTPLENQSVNGPDAKSGVESEDASENEGPGAGAPADAPRTAKDEDEDEKDEPEKSATKVPTGPADFDAAARFDALVKDRDALRVEVTQLRQSIEELQSKHSSEIEAVQTELADTQDAKDTAEEQYQSLLGKVNTIRSQLGERLKADAEELAQSRTRIEDLEEQKSELLEKYTSRSGEVEDLSIRNRELEVKVAEQSKELSSLRNRMTLAQQNWTKEKDELIEQEAYLREEFENAKQAMHDWEVLAMEERTIRRDLNDRHTDLEEQVSTLKEAYEKACSERDTQSSTVDGLQKALQEIQNVRKQELKELVETNQAEQESLRNQLQDLQKRHDATAAELDHASKDLERALPFEKEVKEKNLLIGKLRHEAVILNDHLTKALRFLKKGKPEDNVDRHAITAYCIYHIESTGSFSDWELSTVPPAMARHDGLLSPMSPCFPILVDPATPPPLPRPKQIHQILPSLTTIGQTNPAPLHNRQIVTNHILHFLALDRSDPKKFQILQLIAALLNWTDEQREQAGLARPGVTSTSSSSLRLPGSQLVHRTPSTPALQQHGHDFFTSSPESAGVLSPGSKESLADLWQTFLEQEAGSSGANAKSRTASHGQGHGGLQSPK
ncbi:hypothetical protein LTR84_001812 [Exophiala bonariae]|uniref:GRIP domain-containing protein n=1 Tax=Exophiala bonariae TaxID=1690606 RepID=A0AAV9NBG7_9EURO|nr:hypothetical protein LTR84_001812 [Exophiala bonariae]